MLKDSQVECIDYTQWSKFENRSYNDTAQAQEILNIQVTNWGKMYMFCTNLDKSTILIYLLVLRKSRLEIIPIRTVQVTFYPTKVNIDRFGHLYFMTPYDLDQTVKFSHSHILKKFYSTYTQVSALTLTSDSCYMIGRRRLSKSSHCLVSLTTCNHKLTCELSFDIKPAPTAVPVNRLTYDGSRLIYMPYSHLVVMFDVINRLVKTLHVVELTTMPHLVLLDVNTKMCASDKEGKKVILSNIGTKKSIEIMDDQRSDMARISNDGNTLVALDDKNKAHVFDIRYGSITSTFTIELPTSQDMILSDMHKQHSSQFRPGMNMPRTVKPIAANTKDLSLLYRNDGKMNLDGFLAKIDKKMAVLYEFDSAILHKVSLPTVL